MSRLTKFSYHLEKSKNQPKSIWVQSPCTLPFTNNLPPIDRAERFQYNSIYYKDDPFKPARKIDQFQRPELLLNDFRRSIKEAEKCRSIKKRTSSIRNSQHKEYSLHCKTTQIQKQIIQRLCPEKPKILKMQYDLYGNRSSFIMQNEDAENRPRKIKKNHLLLKRNDSIFTDSQRIDMSRPQNFNPGPGTYFMTSGNFQFKSRQSEIQIKKQKQNRKYDTQKSQTIQIPRLSQFHKRQSNYQTTIQ